jgi:hypothetical protein
MKVNNAYEIGQKVYFINDQKKAQIDTVRSIQVFVYRNKTNIYYVMEQSGETHTEDEVFCSDADLKEDVFRDLLEFT